MAVSGRSPLPGVGDARIKATIYVLVLGAAVISSQASGYFTRRWRGQVSPSRLLWRDMIGFGTLINLVASFAALMLVAQDVPLPWAVALHFAPVPLNLFLFAALCRTPRRTALATGIGLTWVTAMAIA